MHFDSCNKLSASLALSAAAYQSEVVGKYGKAPAYNHQHTGLQKQLKASLGSCLSHMCKSICREQSVRKIFSFKQAAVNGMRPFLWGRALRGLTNSCLYASQRVNKDYERKLLSLQTQGPVTHLNGWTIQVCSINIKRIFFHKYIQIPTPFKF